MPNNPASKMPPKPLKEIINISSTLLGRNQINPNKIEQPIPKSPSY